MEELLPFEPTAARRLHWGRLAVFASLLFFVSMAYVAGPEDRDYLLILLGTAVLFGPVISLFLRVLMRGTERTAYDNDGMFRTEPPPGSRLTHRLVTRLRRRGQRSFEDGALYAGPGRLVFVPATIGDPGVPVEIRVDSSLSLLPEREEPPAWVAFLAREGRTFLRIRSGDFDERFPVGRPELVVERLGTILF